MLELIDKTSAGKALDFTAEDSTGKTFSLSDYRGKSNVVLVLNRGFM